MDFNQLMDRIDRMVNDEKNTAMPRHPEICLRYIELAMRHVGRRPEYTDDALDMLVDAWVRMAPKVLPGRIMRYTMDKFLSRLLGHLASVVPPYVDSPRRWENSAHQKN